MTTAAAPAVYLEGLPHAFILFLELRFSVVIALCVCPHLLLSFLTMDGPPAPHHGGNEGTTWRYSEKQGGDGTRGLHASHSLPEIAAVDLVLWRRSPADYMTFVP